MTTQNQVIISFQGTTGGENLITNPALALTQIASDIGVYAKTVTPAEVGAANFTRAVVSLAALQGITASNVFVTGHSLGGIVAEYAAQQTGVGGIAFEATGIPKSSLAGAGSNFVDIVTYGDPVGNYSSDIKGEQPFAPAYATGQTGTLPHYGQVIQVGNPADQATLSQIVAGANSPFGDLFALPGLIAMLGSFHLPGVQAHDLGVTLSPSSPIIDAAGNMTAPVLAAAGDSIPQLLNQTSHVPAAAHIS